MVDSSILKGPVLDLFITSDSFRQSKVVILVVLVSSLQYFMVGALFIGHFVTNMGFLGSQVPGA